MKATEHVKRIEKEFNAKCLTKDIRNIKEKLNWVCREGHKFSKSIDKINQYSFCTKCFRKEKREKERIEFYKFIKTQEKKYNLTLISEEYIGNKEHLEWRCDNGHLFPAAWANIQSGHGCPYCARKKPLISHTKSAQKLAMNRGGKLLSDDVFRTHDIYLWECSKGHQWEASYTNVKDKESWCPTCAHGEPINLKSMKKIASARGGKCIKYIDRKNGQKNYLFECSEGHQWKGGANKIRLGSWCKECSTGLGERILREYFQQFFKRKFPNVRPDWLKNPKTNKNLELDGFNEDLNIAFEHQGYHHYQNVHGNKRLSNQIFRDEIKKQACKDRGVLLIVVPEIPRLTRLDELDEFIQDILISNKIIKKKKHTKIDYSNAYMTSHNKFQYEKLKDFISSKKGVLLEKNYLGIKELHSIKCNNGHTFKNTPDRLYYLNRWCQHCK